MNPGPPGTKQPLYNLSYHPMTLIQSYILSSKKYLSIRHIKMKSNSRQSSEADTKMDMKLKIDRRVRVPLLD